MLKHYVEFDMPGALFPETTVRLVKDRIPAHIEKVPKYTFALNYFDREEQTFDGEVLLGEHKNKSVRILFGTRYDLAGLRKLGYSKKDALYRNIAGSFPFGVKCITGNWQPASRNDIVLDDYNSLGELTASI